MPTEYYGIILMRHFHLAHMHNQILGLCRNKTEHTRKRKKPRLSAGPCNLAGGLSNELDRCLVQVDRRGQTTRIPRDDPSGVFVDLATGKIFITPHDDVHDRGGLRADARQLELEVPVVAASHPYVGEGFVVQITEEANRLATDEADLDVGAEVATGPVPGRASALRDLFPLVREEEGGDGVTVAHVEAVHRGAHGAGEVGSTLGSEGAVDGGGEEGVNVH